MDEPIQQRTKDAEVRRREALQRFGRYAAVAPAALVVLRAGSAGAAPSATYSVSEVSDDK